MGESGYRNCVLCLRSGDCEAYASMLRLALDWEDEHLGTHPHGTRPVCSWLGANCVKFEERAVARNTTDRRIEP
jgi:hypothetical protein